MSNTVDESISVKQSKIPLYISLGVVIAIIFCYFLIPQVQDFLSEAWHTLLSKDHEKTRHWVSQFGYFGPFIIILSMIAQMFLLVIPTPLLMVVAVLAYGPVWGSIIVLVAVFCASSVGYWIGAYLGPPAVKKILGGKAEQKVESFIDDYGFWAVIITRLSPFLSNDAISFVGGMLKMGYWKFIGATLIGIVPLTFFIAYLGGDTERLQNGLIWGSVISIVLFLAYIWWDKHRGREEQT